ncbi:calponin [Balamuthia mandrillaris]
MEEVVDVRRRMDILFLAKRIEYEESFNGEMLWLTELRSEVTKQDNKQALLQSPCLPLTPITAQRRKERILRREQQQLCFSPFRSPSPQRTHQQHSSPFRQRSPNVSPSNSSSTSSSSSFSFSASPFIASPAMKRSPRRSVTTVGQRTSPLPCSASPLCRTSHAHKLCSTASRSLFGPTQANNKRTFSAQHNNNNNAHRRGSASCSSSPSQQTSPSNQKMKTLSSQQRQVRPTENEGGGEEEWEEEVPEDSPVRHRLAKERRLSEAERRTIADAEEEEEVEKRRRSSEVMLKERLSKQQHEHSEKPFVDEAVKRAKQRVRDRIHQQQQQNSPSSPASPLNKKISLSARLRGVMKGQQPAERSPMDVNRLLNHQKDLKRAFEEAVKQADRREEEMERRERELDEMVLTMKQLLERRKADAKDEDEEEDDEEDSSFDKEKEERRERKRDSSGLSKHSMQQEEPNEATKAKADEERVSSSPFKRQKRASAVVVWRGETEQDLRRRQQRERAAAAQRLYGLDAELAHKAKQQMEPERVKAALRWVYQVAKRPLPKEGFSPSDLLTLDCLKSGKLLCAVANAIRPGIIPRVNQRPIPLMERENLQLYLAACVKMGLRTSDLFTVSDLYEDKYPNAVLHHIGAISRLASSCSSFKGPRL